jgi:phospholipid/cholesterol/gamma-HCH transport system substrate-binding protein
VEVKMFETKKELRWSKIKVGLIGGAAFVVLVLAVLFAGGIEGLFDGRVQFNAQMRNVHGLRKGAPVWLFGTEVGQVGSIELNPAHGPLVTMGVDEEAFGFLKTDARAIVYTMGLLGDKYVELTPGTAEAGPLQPGGLIQGSAQMDLGDVMATSAATVEKITDFIEKLESIITMVGSGEGTIPKLFNDPSLYNKLASATDSLERFSQSLNEGSGSLKRLVEDPALYNRMLAATASLEAFGRRLNEAPGTLKGLIDDRKPYEDLKKATAQLAAVMEKVHRGEGLAGAMVQNEGLAKDLEGALEEFRLLARDIKENPKKYFKISIF